MTVCKEKKAPNWVAARAQCTTKGALSELLKRVREDVSQANLYPTVTRGRKFDVEEKSNGSFAVFAFRNDSGPRELGEITFFATMHKVAIRRDDPHNEIMVTPRWCDEKDECEYFVGGDVFKLWQISKMALCEMFFGEKWPPPEDSEGDG